ncbi:hypothetical protein CKA32_004257 [Geitlerinema sp. FC II]|nr:hypothetical protein CKA32_004257 [Geitlerinema sp. FC II]
MRIYRQFRRKFGDFCKATVRLSNFSYKKNSLESLYLSEQSVCARLLF